MNILLNQIPEGFQTKFFVEETMPECPQPVRWEDNSLTVPCFVRKDVNEDGNEVYKFFTAKIEFGGQNLDDYETLLIQSYAQLRHFFYGTQEQQAEMRDDDQWEGHRQAVRSAFPKSRNETTNPKVIRFDAVCREFWNMIDEILLSVGKTHADLPERPFYDTDMYQWADANQVSPILIEKATGIFIRVALNLEVLKRNWIELFDKEPFV